MKYLLIYLVVSFFASWLFGECMAKTKTPEERLQDDIDQIAFMNEWQKTHCTS